jgi:murein DD-endopeptidase MepM/ murein hydrolase activator NlpD
MRYSKEYFCCRRRITVKKQKPGSIKRKRNKKYLPAIYYFIACAFFSIIFLINPHNAYTDPAGSKVPFIKPLEGNIVLAFRQPYFDIEEKVERRHTGIDLKGSFGEKILASANGVVSYRGISPTGGLTIVIRHNLKIRSTYLNLLEAFLTPGDTVLQGETVGIIGADDDPSTSGPHLHFGIIYNGYYLDPEDILGMDYRNISAYITLKHVKPDFNIEVSHD